MARPGDVNPAEGLLVGAGVGDPVREHDHPGARPVHRHPGGDPLAQRPLEAEGAHELVHRRRLPAGDAEAVDLGHLLGPPDRDGAGAADAQGHDVLTHVTLDCEDADEGDAGHDR